MPWLSSILSNVVLASLLALTAWFVQARLRHPGVARVLWLLALVKLVTPPLVSVSLIDLPGSMACALGACHCAQHAGTTALVRDQLPWILLAVWSTGAVATLILTGRCWLRFQRLTAHARAAPPEWQTLAARLAAELSTSTPPVVLAAPGRLPPLVVPGWRRPRLLLPLDLIDKLNARQKEALLLHELLHLQRGDHLVRLLEFVVGVVYWWLPGVRSIGRRLRACEESCCDAGVIARRPRARRDYARLILDVIDFAYPPATGAPQATAMSGASDVAQRVRSILNAGNDRPATRCRRSVAALTIAMAGALLPCGLHYDFVGGSIVVAPDACESVSRDARLAGANRPVELPLFCCPR